MSRIGFSDTLASLRGIAALVVVVYHSVKVFQVGSFDDPYLLRLQWGDGWLFASQLQLILFNGRSAVTLFFVLSGAVLTVSLLRSQTLGPSGLVAYYIRRGFRLYPLLICVALAAAALHIYYFTHGEQSAMTSWAAKRYQHSPAAWEIFTNAIGYRSTLNPPSWTIYIEIVASLFFPLFFVAATSGRTAVAMGIILLTIPFLPSHPALQQAGSFMICFFVGALIPIYGEPVARIFLAQPSIVRIVATLAIVGVFLAFNQIYLPAVEADPVRILIETACAAFIVCLAYYANVPQVFRSRPFLYLGEISYGVYLIHFGILFVLAHSIAPAPETTLSPGAALGLNALLAVATILVTIPMAAVIHRFIERPCQQLGRRFGSKTLCMSLLQTTPSLTGHTYNQLTAPSATQAGIPSRSNSYTISS